jgi:hypothetical protein
MWTPPANVTQAGIALQGSAAYEPGSFTSPSDPQVQREPGEGTKVLAQWIKTRWGLTQAGARRSSSMSSPAQRADGTWRRRDLHEDGRAIDAMTGRDRAKGAQIANVMILFADKLGVQYLVFDGLEWSVARIGPAWEPIRGSRDRATLGRGADLHEDHVHIELFSSAARDGQRMRAVLVEIDRALANSPLETVRRGLNQQRSGPSPVPALLIVFALVVGVALAVRFWRRKTQ